MDGERITLAALGGLVALLGLTLLIRSLRRFAVAGACGPRRGGWLISLAWAAGALAGIGLILVGVVAAVFVLTFRGD